VFYSRRCFRTKLQTPLSVAFIQSEWTYYMSVLGLPFIWILLVSLFTCMSFGPGYARLQ